MDDEGEIDDAFVFAVKAGNTKTVDELLGRGANVDARSIVSNYDLNVRYDEVPWDVSFCALAAAVVAGDVDMARRLLCHGANVHAVDEALDQWSVSRRQTAMHMAFLTADSHDENEFEMAELLLAAGARTDQSYNDGCTIRTIMQNECRDFNFDSIRWLLVHGSDPEDAFCRLAVMAATLKNLDDENYKRCIDLVELATIRLRAVRADSRNRVQARVLLYYEEMMAVTWNPTGPLFHYYLYFDDEI